MKIYHIKILMSLTDEVNKKNNPTSLSDLSLGKPETIFIKK